VTERLFAVLYLSIRPMGLRRCYKMTVVTFLFAFSQLNLFIDVYYRKKIVAVL